METWQTFALAQFLKPFAFLVLVLVVLYPARRAVEKYVPDGRLKRFLLWRTN